MRMEVTHAGGLRFEVRVRDQRFTVDVPEDIGGSNRGPTPTELFCASLATCAGVYIAAYCASAGLPYEGFSISADWEVLEHPKRIATVNLKVDMPAPLPADRQKAVFRAAHQCLLHRSIANAVQIDLEIRYPEEE